MSPNEPVFGEPWQAQAFALTVHLIDRGAFSAAEWAEVLGDQRRQVEAEADGGDEYYRSWLNALEKLLTRKGLADPTVLADLKRAWIVAYERTPHGQPVRLE